VDRRQLGSADRAVSGEPTGTHPSERALDLAKSKPQAFLVRMGEPSWARYARFSLVTGALGRRRGASGLVLRRLCYPVIFRRARRPLILEDVVLRGAGRIELGADVLIEHLVCLDAKTDASVGITIGDRSVIRIGTILDTGYHGKIDIGAGTELGPYCELRGLGGVVVGDKCLFARNVTILSSEHVVDDATAPVVDQGNRSMLTTVGAGAWLGANVVVLAGVRIGAGAVIGANAVVRDDIPAGAVAVGAPARVVRTRAGHGGGSDGVDPRATAEP
jgi:acetyltransferase-like isoleucine patch superfamily enzyme